MEARRGWIWSSFVKEAAKASASDCWPQVLQEALAQRCCRRMRSTIEAHTSALANERRVENAHRNDVCALHCSLVLVIVGFEVENAALTGCRHF